MLRRPIDLRSDTVTQPDSAMRQVMAAAEVGDDVYGEDPTVRRLEREAADLLGHQASLFLPSGTMGNQIALHLHGHPGGEVICEAKSHIVLYELGAMAALSGLLPCTLVADRGLLTAPQVEGAVAPEVVYRSRTVAVVIENSHNMAGGTLYDRPRREAILAVTRQRGLPVHLDGARLFNASEALGESPADLAAGFDSVMVSLSKGLGAPVGSLLAGSAALIEEARRVRKMLGGAMRQAGILAAAGLLALERGPARLAADHRNARTLAEGLAVRGWTVDPSAVATNIVIAGPPDGDALAFCRRAEAKGVKAVAISPGEVRFVTHHDVSEQDIGDALARLAEA
ncbi:MAG: GntG family PLP-dependent aldolase [Acidobacteriota bacterium]